MLIVQVTATSLILLLLNVLQQLWMHCSQCHEQSLNWRVVGNAATSLWIAAHSVHKDLNAATKCRQELLAVLVRPIASRHLTVLISLHTRSHVITTASSTNLLRHVYRVRQKQSPIFNIMTKHLQCLHWLHVHHQCLIVWHNSVQSTEIYE